MPDGTLVIVATPIGNLDDLSARARQALEGADVVACEDTRHTRRIFERYGIERPEILFSCHGHNEKGAVRRTLSLLRMSWMSGKKPPAHLHILRLARPLCSYALVMTAARSNTTTT